MHHIYRFGLILIALQSQPCFALSWETNICIRNTTASSHQITVADIANYDWDGVSRPDKNFNNIAIEAGATICRREEVNQHANQQSFTFIVDDTPTRVRFDPTVKECVENRCNYSQPRWGAFTNKKAPLTLYGNRSISWQRNDWLVGYPCNDKVRCSLFEIR